MTDLLEEYGLMLNTELKSFFDLKPGDSVYVKVVPGAFLEGIAESGLHTVNRIGRCDLDDVVCDDCTSNGCCIYINFGKDSYKGTCNSYVYDENGNRFRENFGYYEKHPTYEE